MTCPRQEGFAILLGQHVDAQLENLKGYLIIWTRAQPHSPKDKR